LRSLAVTGGRLAFGLTRARTDHNMSMRFAVKASPQNTTWDAMLEVWRAADSIELFESGWTFDHFYPILGEDSFGPCLEGWVTLAALA
jgi:alkanesulfonate monooxygenase SsuD/methylene tetrahydromethanopterin reductase-like flavin-dependent oxidoreductase (luciferase family)